MDEKIRSRVESLKLLYCLCSGLVLVAWAKGPLINASKYESFYKKKEVFD